MPNNMFGFLFVIMFIVLILCSQYWLHGKYMFVVFSDDSVAQAIKIKLSKRQANYMCTLPLHHSQQEIETNENYSIFKFFIKPTFDFRQELLSLGEVIKVISPISFRNELLKVIANMNRMYTKN